MPLGAGGMGEVYKAMDTRLERTVAVKVLPPHLSTSPETRQRFEREAKTISQLSHPHICAVHDVGREGETEYLVMEYLEGETLGARLANGPLPLEQTLRYGQEIADALDKAHRQGIVHRDLKPGNVMITKTGVKLLDFGLAKAMSPSVAKGSLTSLPTQQGLTQEGTILGTFQYMAPEQLEGKEADGRTDIFAFGAVLYELATGKKAFSAASQASLITAIMSLDPPAISSVQPMSPPALDRVVSKCLVKDPEDRWQSAGDLGSELKWIAESGSRVGAVAPVVASRRWPLALPWAIAGLLVVGLLAVLNRKPATVAEPVVFTLQPPAGHRFGDTVALSPDGKRIAFLTNEGGYRRSLWIRSLDSLEARRIDGIRDARYPFWSPDGKSVAFFENFRLKRVGVNGGEVQAICDSGNGYGGTWGPNGRIVFAPEYGRSLQVVPAGGGAPAPVTVLDAARGDGAHVFPFFLPDGRHFVFVARNDDPMKNGIMLGDLDSQQSRLLALADSKAVWSADGYLLFAREGPLLAQKFDARRLTLEGEPIPVSPSVRFFTDTGSAVLSSGGNTLAYGLWPHERRLVWVDRQGREVGTLGAVADYDDLAISPDGRQVAVSVRDPERSRKLNIWVLDVERGTASRVTTARKDQFDAVWTPDGEQLIYISERAFYDLCRRPASGGPEQVILRTDWDKGLSDVSPDGQHVLFAGSPEQHADDIWMADVAGDSQPKAIVQTAESTERSARFSPDGRYIAYSSDESGRSEVYVQPLPTGLKRLISDDGGVTPIWRRDGKEIFYCGSDGRLNAVAVKSSSSGQEYGPPQPLFDLRLAGTSSYYPRQFDVAPDGTRFLVVRRVGAESDDPVALDIHWTARLKGE